MSNESLQLIFCAAVAVIITFFWELWFDHKKKIAKEKELIEKEFNDSINDDSNKCTEEKRTNFSKISPGIGDRKTDI